MNYVELREQAEELGEIWGYNNTQRKPNWNRLVNQAYIDLCWITDAIKGPSITFNTVIDQAEYDLKTLAADLRDFKSILDAVYDGTVKLHPVDLAQVRREDPLWMTRASNQPIAYWIVRPNIMRLHNKPSAVKSVEVNAVRSPVILAADTDIPAIPLAYHEGLPVRAAYLHAKKYAKTPQQLDALQLKDAEWQKYVDALSQQVQEQYGMDGVRWVQPVEADRISL